jgi:hypothetical protein
MSAIFGGSKQKQSQESKNLAFPWAQQTFGGAAGATGDATNALSAMLGLGGDTAAQNAAFDNFRNSSGYNFVKDQAMDAVTSNKAASGLLQSGSYGTALQDRASNLASQTSQQYLQNLLGLGNLGLGAGGLVVNAGQTSKSSGESSTKPGLGGFIGKLGTGIAASDRRLKKDIVKIGDVTDGINLYKYNYIHGSGPYIGVMADEIEKYLPEALGPVIDGYMTVNYDILREKYDYGF